MKLPHPLRVKLSPLVEAARGEPLVEPFVEMRDDGPERLLLDSPNGHFVFDRAARRILRDGVDLGAFDAVRSVDVSAFPGGLGEPSWALTLYRGALDRTTVARTYDDGEASVVAAKLARTLGCKVVSLAGRR